MLNYYPKLKMRESIIYTAEWYKQVHIENKNPNEITNLQIKNFFMK